MLKRIRKLALLGASSALDALGAHVVRLGWKHCDPQLVQNGSQLLVAAVMLSELAEGDGDATARFEHDVDECDVFGEPPDPWGLS